MIIERFGRDVRVCVGVASLLMGCGTALGQSTDSSKPAAVEEGAKAVEQVGGLDIPNDGEVVGSKQPKALGYITDPLFLGRIGEASHLRLLEREVRKMKQSPPTPEELKITTAQGETIEQMFADHRELLREYNNETRLEMLALRKAGGLEVKKTAEEEEEFSPMLFIDAQLIEPSGRGEAAIKVARLTVEQHAAREDLRALIMAGPVTDDLRIQVMAVLEEDQLDALEAVLEAEEARILKNQAARERTKRTGRMDIEDLPQKLQDKLNEMEPRMREAALNKIRMNKISGGAAKMKEHRRRFREETQKGIREREEKAQQRQADQDKVENPDEGE